MLISIYFTMKLNILRHVSYVSAIFSPTIFGMFLQTWNYIFFILFTCFCLSYCLTCYFDICAINLYLTILMFQSLLNVLRESHRTRTVFRKVGGFVYVMSVLVSMEGCLANPPKSPWHEGTVCDSNSRCVIIHFIMKLDLLSLFHVLP